MNEIDSLTYYTATKKYDLRFPILEGDIDVDVVIIGGGFSGINTALELAEQGITNIAVLEARYLGYGGTGRNGGQVMAGIGHDLEKIKKHVGVSGLETIFRISSLGAGIIQDRIKKYDIDADFRHGYCYLGMNSRQEKTLRTWYTEFKAVSPQDEIEFYTGSEVQQVIGSDQYSSAIKHMGAGHVHSLNLLLGEAKALASYGVKIFENSSVLDVQYGSRITVRTAMGTVRASKLLWACNGFLEKKMEPHIYQKTINTYAYQMATEPLSDELIDRISPIRGAYTDIRTVLNYYRVTNENRLLFGSAPMLEYVPSDLKAWNRARMLTVFPYLKDVRIDMAWGGPLCCSVNLFPQIGTLPNYSNVFFVQGYTGFGVTPSHIVCKILAEGMNGGSARYDLLSSIPHMNIYGKDEFRRVITTLGKVWQQTAGYWTGRS